MASGRSSRIPSKTPKYPYSDSNDSGNYSGRYIASRSSRRSSTLSNNPQETYMPPKQSPQYSSRCKPNQGSCFDNDFGPFGTVFQQQDSSSKQMNDKDDINSMFRRPDYNPIPCSENIRGPPCPSETGNFRVTRGTVGSVGAVQPVRGSRGSYSNRSSLDHSFSEDSHRAKHLSNPLLNTEPMSVIHEVEDHSFHGALPLPPTNEPPVSTSFTGARKSYTEEDFDKILSKYGKRSSKSNLNELEEKDPDFSIIRQPHIRPELGKECQLIIDNGVQGFWNNRNNDDTPRTSGRRRRSSSLDKSIEDILQQMNNFSTLQNNGSGAENANLQRYDSGPTHRQEGIPERNEIVYNLMEIDNDRGNVAITEIKRNTHVFPFKQTTAGHLVVEPAQVAFESRKISVLIADPNNNMTSFEFQREGGNIFSHNISKNEQILKEIKRAMNMDSTMSSHNGIQRTLSKMQNPPPKEVYSKPYSESKEATEEFQQNLLQRLICARNADTCVMIGDKAFPCHSTALEVFSSFFDRMARSPEFIQRIQLPEAEVSPTAFPILMDWIFQSNEDRKEILNKENLVQVYVAARYLCMKELEFQCVTFLEKNVDISDPDLLNLWDEVKKRQTSCPELVRIMSSKMSASYHDIYATKKFLQMDIDELSMLLTSDDVSISSEMEVYDSAVSWLLHDWKNRKVYTNKIMSTVRFGLLSPLQLTQINLCPEWSKIKSEKDYNQILTYGTVKAMIDDGLAYSILAESYDSQPEELRKWVDKTGVKAPAPRTRLSSKISGNLFRVDNPGDTIPQNNSASRSHGLGINDKGNSKSRIPGAINGTEMKKSQENQGRNVVHEITKPKLLSNSSNILKGTGSQHEVEEMEIKETFSSSPPPLETRPKQRK